MSEGGLELGTFCPRERYLNHSATAPQQMVINYGTSLPFLKRYLEKYFIKRIKLKVIKINVQPFIEMCNNESAAGPLSPPSSQTFVGLKLKPEKLTTSDVVESIYIK